MQGLLNKTKGNEYWETFLKDEKLNPDLFFKRDSITKEEAKELFKKHVCIVNMETSTLCNRKCDYCPLSSYSRDEQILTDDELYTKIVSDLSSIDYHSTVSLNLYNEPLLDPKICSRIKELRKACPNCFIKFNSNGDYLTMELLEELIDSGLNAIFLTMHVLRGKNYSDDDRLNALKKFFEKLDLDCKINEMIPNEKIVCDVYYKGLRLLTEAHNWKEFGNDRGGAVEFLSSKSRITPCVRPIREIAIAFDGRMYPCCQFYPDCDETKNYIAGKIDKSNSIFEIYASKFLTQWRKHLFTYGEKIKPCATCKDIDYSPENTEELRVEILNNIKH